MKQNFQKIRTPASVRNVCVATGTGGLAIAFITIYFPLSFISGLFFYSTWKSWSSFTNSTFLLPTTSTTDSVIWYSCVEMTFPFQCTKCAKIYRTNWRAPSLFRIITLQSLSISINSSTSTICQRLRKVLKLVVFRSFMTSPISSSIR